MYNFKRVKWIVVTALLSVVCRFSSMIAGVLANFTLFGIKPLSLLAIPFQFLGILSTPLVIATVVQIVLLLFPKLKDALSRLGKRGSHRRDSEHASETESSQVTNVNVVLNTSSDDKVKEVDSFD